MTGARSLEARIADGTARVEGDPSILKQLAATMVDFDPRFEIMPGTNLTEPPPTEGDAFEVEVGAPMRLWRNSRQVRCRSDPMSQHSNAG
jgi:hypothetical protein